MLFLHPKVRFEVHDGHVEQQRSKRPQNFTKVWTAGPYTILARPVISGLYLPTLQTVFPDLRNQPCSTAATPEALQQLVADVAASSARMIREGRAEEVLIAGVASLQLFLQANLTGPQQSVPQSPLHIGGGSEWPISSGSTPTGSGSLGVDVISEGDRWAVARLGADGEDTDGILALPQYLVLATVLLLSPLGLLELGHMDTEEALTGLERSCSQLPATWSWWAVRTLTTQQRVLSGLSSSIRAALLALLPMMLASVSGAAEVLGEWRQPVTALAHLEAVLVEHLYSYPSRAADQLRGAGEAIGFSAELTGAMGLRTEHQQDPKAQLVVNISKTDQGDEPEGSASELLDAAGVEDSGLVIADDSPSSRDVLENIRLVDGAGTSGRREVTPLEQAVLLAHGEQQKRSSAKDEVRPWQIAAFTNVVLAQPLSAFTLRMAARLSRIRFERERSRTRERALIAMEHLTHCSNAPFPPAHSRSCFGFAVLLPLSSSLQKEYGEQLVASGMVGAAMQVFEKLELWDNLLVCYRLLDKVPQALALVKARLEVFPGDAKLLCALGDLTLDTQHYQAAWECSKGRSSRAQRSLARFHMGKTNYQQAAEHWELGLAVNSLHPEGWFSLGYCHMKTGNLQRALQAFTKCTQQQPDNGDAWNNVAAIYLQEAKYKESYSALSEAIKYKRDSWQTWSNYAAAAVKTGNLQPAARAVEQVGNLTQWQKQEVGILQSLVASIATTRASGVSTQGKGGDKMLERAVRGALTAAANSSAATPAVWGLIAQLNEAQGYTDSARDAYKKQIRALSGQGWQQNASRFQEYAAAVLASAKFASAQASAAGSDAASRKDVAASRMLLQSLIKSTPEEFRSYTLYGEAEAMLAVLTKQ